MTSVYKLFKLAKVGQNYSKDHKVLVRDLHVVTDKWAERINESSETNGEFYELDTEATKLYQDGKDFRNVQPKTKK
jgi:hypothetical protein